MACTMQDATKQSINSAKVDAQADHVDDEIEFSEEKQTDEDSNSDHDNGVCEGTYFHLSARSTNNSCIASEENGQAASNQTGEK